MLTRKFHFPTRPDEAEWCNRLRSEIGPRRFSHVDADWHDGGLDLETMDRIAMAYASKVCVQLGGELVRQRWHARVAVPTWTATPWVELPWTAKLGIWIRRTDFWS